MIAVTSVSIKQVWRAASSNVVHADDANGCVTVPPGPLLVALFILSDAARCASLTVVCEVVSRPIVQDSGAPSIAPRMLDIFNNVAIIISGQEPRITVFVEVLEPTPIPGIFFHPVKVAYESYDTDYDY